MILLLAMFGTLLLLLILGAPIAVALGGSGIFWIWVLQPQLLNGLGYAIWNTSNSYVLLAVPMFLAMGEIIERSNIGTRFYRSLSPWVRWLPGGLLHSNIAACAIFAAVSGSSVATTATVGATAIPELTRLGYRRKLIFGTLAAGGTLGILIPPSIPMIIYAALVEVSLGKLFVAAVIPGLVVVVMFAAYVIFQALRHPQQSETKEGDEYEVSAIGLWESWSDLLPIFGIISVILGGIYLGIATPTEVAAIGLLIAMGVAAMYSNLSWPVLRASVASAVRFTAMIMFVIIGANIFSFALFSWGVTREVAAAVSGMDAAPVLIIVALVGIYLILGMFIEPISMMVLTISVVAPIIQQLGYDLVWFGIILVLLLEIGLITPPVGINLYTIRAVAGGDTRIIDVALGALPFVVLLLFAIALMIAVPQIVLFLPNTMFH